MIDTYFDRVDAATGYKPTKSAPVQDDPRYFNGSLYATAIDCNVARAKCNLDFFIDMTYEHHMFEMWHSFRRLEHANRHLSQ